MQGSAQQQQQLLAQHRELLSQPTTSPVPHLTHAVAGFAEQLAALHDARHELAAVAPPDRMAGSVAEAGPQAVLQVLRSMHEVLVHVAARVARLNATSQQMRQAHLRVRIVAASSCNRLPSVCADGRACLVRGMT